ncbi:MAG: hypothetical protein KBG15_10290 [Kofleriaceae bacterium]|nr:hypothetical protein [Kofleriaceae bacterium]
MSYPGEKYDPAGSAYPFTKLFYVEHNHKRYGIYPITFIAPSAAGRAVFGFWGLHIFPLLCGLWACHLVALLATQVTRSKHWGSAAALTLLVATPVGANAALFNEHAPGLAFFLAGICLLARQSPSRWQLLVSGAALGFSATLRPELLAGVPAIVMFVVALRGINKHAAAQLLWAGLGAVPILALFAAYNFYTTGYVLPSLVANLTASPPTDRWAMVRLLYDDRAPTVATRRVLVLFFALVGLAWTRVLPRRPVLFAAAIVVGLWTYYAALALDRVTPGVGQFRTAIGLFTTCPLLVIGLLVGIQQADRAAQPEELHALRLARACALCAVALGSAIFFTNAARDAGGLQLGARHLLVVVPLLLVPTAAVCASLSRTNALTFAAIAALAISLWAAKLNIVAFRAVARDSETLTSAVAKSQAKDVVTNFWWGPQVLAPLWDTHRIYRPGSYDFMHALEKSGVIYVVQALGGLETQPRLTVDSVHHKALHVMTFRFQRNEPAPY